MELSSGQESKPKGIVSKLRTVEVRIGQGEMIGPAVKSIGVTEQTYYRLLSVMLCITCQAMGVRSMAGFRLVRRSGSRSWNKRMHACTVLFLI